MLGRWGGKFPGKVDPGWSIGREFIEAGKGSKPLGPWKVFFVIELTLALLEHRKMSNKLLNLQKHGTMLVERRRSRTQRQNRASLQKLSLRSRSNCKVIFSVCYFGTRTAQCSNCSRSATFVQ